MTIKNSKEKNAATALMAQENEKNHYIIKDEMRYAGSHLVIELWEARFLDNLDNIRMIMTDATHACGATLIDLMLHQFGNNGGVTGVAMLSESHISIHSLQEYDYAALDIFVCGKCDPYKAIIVFREGFLPKRIQVAEHKRGLII